MPQNKTALKIILLGLCFMLAIPFAYSAISGYRIGANITKSLPYKIMIYQKTSGFNPKIGDIVCFNLPVDVPSSYRFKRGDLFAKRVVGVAGDFIEQNVTKNGEVTTYINGICVSNAITEDKLGNKLKPFFFSGNIPEGYVFVQTSHPHSFDSRYFGFIQTKNINGIVKYAF